MLESGNPTPSPGLRQGLDGIDDGDRFVLWAGAHDDLDRVAILALGHQPLGRLEAGLVLLDEPAGRGQDVPDRPEVLLQAQARRRARRRAIRRVGWRSREARIELGEGGVAGAAEPVDALVVVAHDHHVVRPVRRPAEQFDQLDLGNVGVLELVDQQVAILALEPAQHVGPRPEQLGHGGDLLAVIERAAACQFLFVGAVYAGELCQAHDLQGGAVRLVGRRQPGDPWLILRREPAGGHGLAGAGDRPARLTVGGASGLVRTIRALLAAFLRALVGAHLRVVASNLAQWREVALQHEPLDCGGVAPKASLVDTLLLGHERIEVVRRDELVLASIDEPDEVTEVPVGAVVDQTQVGSQVLDQEHLADAVEDIGPWRQAGVGRVLGQDPLAEAVVVADRHPARHRHPDRRLQTLAQFRGRLDVVRQDQEMFRQEAVIACGVGRQQVAHPLDDHPRLARARPSDHHRRPVAPFHDPPLLGRQRVRAAHVWVDHEPTIGPRGRRQAFVRSTGSRY